MPSFSSSTITNFLCKSLSFGTRKMSLNFHAFAGNPSRSRTPRPTDALSPQSALQTLRSLLSSPSNGPVSPDFRVLPFRKGRPLAGLEEDGPTWRLGWLSLWECKRYLEDSEIGLKDDSLVYLGCDYGDDVVYWGVDVSDAGGLVGELGARRFCFVELRTLMVATDWTDAKAMGELAVAGHARALLEWHDTARFCGHCGSKSVSVEAGKRRQCSNELCKKRIYPRLDPVVIMLVIDKENDRALLSKQSRFVPRMWSCLAGFIEPGESLEEAVRRETLEETGIEVGEVVYHSSQPWPVGPSSMPCQLMVGFFAYAKTLDISVDKAELEDAQWHNREDVKKALTFAEYRKAQKTAAAKVEQMCRGLVKEQSLSSDFNVESGELAPMFVPGPFAIAHHLISCWANQKLPSGTTASSLSNL
ncbi:nudix hydrolase homolog 19 [Striga asiatica]|uniref:NAD(+) diphosphatase n=1 Tax=Striga asiatica TaxID=4170 RepID=A0A5A7PWP7_STRAF|nr:nudix hydrolase homolog 19 [Striga asiatica]